MNIKTKLSAIVKFLSENIQTGLTTAMMKGAAQCPQPAIILVETEEQALKLARDYSPGGWVDIMTVDGFAARSARWDKKVKRPLFIDNYPLTNLLHDAAVELGNKDRTIDHQGMENARLRALFNTLERKAAVQGLKLRAAERALEWVVKSGLHSDTPQVALDVIRSEDGQGSSTCAVLSSDTLKELLQP